MNSRERITAILAGKCPDRVGFQDADFFSDTVERWRREGLPDGIDVIRESWPWLNVRGLRYFGNDIYVTWADTSPKYDLLEYEVGENWSIVRDEFGTAKKSWTGKTASPQYLDPIVRSPEDFKEKVEPLLSYQDFRRVSSPHYPFKKQLQEMVRGFQREFFVVAGMSGPFEYSMWLCGGLATTLIFLMKNRDFAPYMFSRIGDFLGEICEAYVEAGVDGLWLFEDQGSQDGPFLSPELYARLLKPAHKRICAPFAERALPRLLHSDGNIEALVPHFIESGFVGLHPLQNKIGMDVKKLKERYGNKLTLIGGIDTRVLCSGDLAAIESEVKTKISVAGRGGGYIAASDGPVPPTIPLEHYKFYVEKVKRHGQYALPR